MRSIYAKVLAWSMASFVIALLTLGAVLFSLEHRRPGPIDFLNQTLVMIGDEVCDIYKERDSKRLAAYLARLNTYYGVEHFVIDSSGHDVVSGTELSPFIKGIAAPDGPPQAIGDRHVILRSLPDPSLRLLIRLPYSFDLPSVLPYFACLMLVIATLGYILAVHLVAPLRSLRQVVDRFGGGDLTVRARSYRKDEIGELSRAFDEMANQIETLRTAEVRLLQDVSHELRSPLTRIGFNLELARLGGDRETTFDRLTKDLDRLKKLVDELLQLTRAEGDPGARGMVPITARALTASVVDDCNPESEARGCAIVTSLEQEVLILGDPELLRRAIENVLRNAIRYSPANSKLEVELHREQESVMISIRDHGPGVPDHALESIFQPFFRIEDDRSRSSGGVGLGLAIAKRAVMLHHGNVSASNAHPGLRVTIEIPNALG